MGIQEPFSKATPKKIKPDLSLNYGSWGLISWGGMALEIPFVIFFFVKNVKIRPWVGSLIRY